MTTRFVPLRDLSPSEVEAWRELAIRAAQPNVFFEPEFVLPAAEHLDADGVGLLVTEDGEGWSACLPVRAGRLGRVVKSLLSWRHPYCFLGTPLVDGDRLQPALAAMLDHALRRQGRPLLAVDRMAEGPVLDAIRDIAAGRSFDVVLERPQTRAALVRRPEATYFDDLKAHRRRELNRLGRRLEDELGAALVVEDRSGEAEAVESFLALEASGWKGQAGTAMASKRSHADFFRAVCRGYAEQGRLQMLSQEAAGRPVAMKCNLASGDTLFCFKIGHDAELERFSPGVLLERANVGIFHETRAERLMDSCADSDNQMINRLWPDQLVVTTTLLSRRGVSSAFARGGIAAIHALRPAERRKSSNRS